MALTYQKIRKTAEKAELGKEVYKILNQFSEHRNQSISYAANRCILGMNATEIDDDGRLPAPRPLETWGKSKMYHEYITAMANLVRTWWSYQKNTAVYAEVMEKIQKLEHLHAIYENN